MQSFLQHDKAWRIGFWLVLAFGGLSFFSAASRADINGAAVYEQYGKEQFLAILKLPTPTDDAQVALHQASGAVMEYVITANTLSKRRLSRHWLEAVVVNADRSAVDTHSNALAQLMDLMKGPLVHGDHLAIAATDSGIQVSLNELAIGTIAAPGLFPVLLQTWIGPVPPSSAFRSAILSSGEPPSGLVQRYQSTHPTAERRIQVEQAWLSETAPAIDAALPTAVSALEDAIDPATTPPIIEPSLGLSSAIEPDSIVAQAPTLPLTAIDTPPALSDDDAQKSASLALATNATPIGEAALAETQLASIDPAAGQSINAVLLSKDYYDQIKRKVYQEVHYPPIALRQGRESEVALNIKIDPNGALLAVDLSDESRYKYFNKAAINAVESASPFAPPPPVLVEEGIYQFRMQVNFRITPPS